MIYLLNMGSKNILAFCYNMQTIFTPNYSHSCYKFTHYQEDLWRKISGYSVPASHCLGSRIDHSQRKNLNQGMEILMHDTSYFFILLFFFILDYHTKISRIREKLNLSTCADNSIDTKTDKHGKKAKKKKNQTKKLIVMCLVSGVMCQVSCVMCCMSHVTYYLSIPPQPQSQTLPLLAPQLCIVDWLAQPLQPRKKSKC